MAGTVRLPKDLINALTSAPQNYDFFQMVRLLLQKGLKLEDIQFKANPQLHFAAASIVSIIFDKDKVNIEQSFLALAGQNGVLPDHFAEVLLQRLEAKDSSLQSFLDLFNHRLTQLFYQCWQQSRFYVNYEQYPNLLHHDQCLSLIKALTGQAEFTSHKQFISNDFLIYYSGLLSQKQKNSHTLKLILQDYFDLPITIEPFQKEWLDIPSHSQSTLTKREHYNHLGKNLILGKKFLQLQNRFNVVVGPLDYHNYYQLLPHKEKIKTLSSLIKLYCGMEFTFSIQLLLKQEDIPLCQLGLNNSPYLGWNTCLASRNRTKNLTRITPQALSKIYRCSINRKSTGRVE